MCTCVMLHGLIALIPTLSFLTPTACCWMAEGCTFDIKALLHHDGYLARFDKLVPNGFFIFSGKKVVGSRHFISKLGHTKIFKTNYCLSKHQVVLGT